MEEAPAVPQNVNPFLIILFSLTKDDSTYIEEIELCYEAFRHRFLEEENRRKLKKAPGNELRSPS
jgi:hypothetical protein